MTPSIAALADPLPLARDLIRCPSVTPAEAGVLDTLGNALESLGFTCTRLVFETDGTDPVDNLFAERVGDPAGPALAFAGHTDVVPVGGGWTVDPFGAEIIDGHLFGRGAADMKGAIAAFVAATARLLADGPPPGRIQFLITNDEEGPSVNGTVKLMPWLRANGRLPDACIVGEPTNPRTLGEMAKIGRRGSLNGWITVHGMQGHTAYPHLAQNPVPRLARLITHLSETALDHGTDHFQPSTLVFSDLEVGNPATNVIPPRATARFNVRFNDLHRSADVIAWVRARCAEVTGEDELDLRVTVSGEPFLTPPGPLSGLVTAAVQAVTGRAPELSTTGGTSDARFIRHYCPVVEFGGVGATMHKSDERLALADLAALADIYREILGRFFAGAVTP